MAEGSVLLEQGERVATIRMNKPRKNNTVDAAVVDEFEQVIEAVAAMPDLAAIVVTGAGDHAFCGGLDSSVLLEQGAATFGALVRRFWLACWRLAHLPPPVIAAINGYSYAGGVVLACSSDLRVAVADATFTIPASEYGLAVGTYQLPYLVNDCAAKEIILLARPVNAVTLYRMGLLNRVVETQGELSAAVEEWVSRFRQLSPTGVRNNKALLNQTLDIGPAAALEAELANDARHVMSPDFRERIAAAVAQRRAQRAAQPPQS